MHWKDENANFVQLRTKPSKTLIFSSFNPLKLRIHNENPFPILFKLKTTQPNILASQPARGFISGNSSIDCYLTPIELKSRVVLVIQYAQILNEYEDYFHQWKNLKSEQILLKKFSCSFQEKTSLEKRFHFFQPILLTFATVTLFTTWIYFRNKK